MSPNPYTLCHLLVMTIWFSLIGCGKSPTQHLDSGEHHSKSESQIDFSRMNSVSPQLKDSLAELLPNLDFDTFTAKESLPPEVGNVLVLHCKQLVQEGGIKLPEETTRVVFSRGMFLDTECVGVHFERKDVPSNYRGGGFAEVRIAIHDPQKYFVTGAGD